MSSREKALLVALAIIVVGVATVTADPAQFSGAELVFMPAVSDMRVVGAIMARSANAPTPAKSLKDLRAGSVFINEDGQARIVTAVYEDRGRVVIETEEPRPEYVISYAYVPDFQLQMTMDNLASLAPGVSIADSSRADDARDLFESDLDAATRDKVSWITTDDEIDDMMAAHDDLDLRMLRIDKVLWSSGIRSSDVEALKKMQSSGKTNGTNGSASTPGDSGDPMDPSAGGGTGSAIGEGTGTSGSGEATGGSLGGKPEGSAQISGEIRLQGVLRYILPQISGGFKAPSCKVSWIIHWWHPPIPKFEFSRGYARVQVESAQQFDFKLTGTLNLSAEVKVPIAMFVVIEPHTQLKFECGLYAKITLDGSITLGVEVSEYSRSEAHAGCDLVWPFIPVKVGGGQDNYFHTAFRPFLAASAELTGGLYVGGELSWSGIGLASLEAGGGLYVGVNGYIEPLGVMGYDSKIGGYGSFDEWIIYVNAEAGAFFKVTLGLLIWSHDLFSMRWPFWTWANQWEF